MKRIDEILLEQNKVSEKDITKALSRQKAVGGKLCSHLLDSGAVNEEDLLKALSEHFGVPAVSISSITIHSDTLKLIPSNIAVSRVIIPFEYDREQNLVKIACIDPNDSDLRSEINYLLEGMAVEYYVTVEQELVRTINLKYDLLHKTDSSPQFTKTQDQNTLQTEAAAKLVYQNTSTIDSNKVLIFSEHQSTRQLLHVVLEKDGYTVTDISSIDLIEENLKKVFYRMILIQSDMPDKYVDLTKNLRLISPSTQICMFQSMSDLILNNQQPVYRNKLEKKLELFTSLLTIQERVPSSQSMRVAYFIDKLCRNLGLKDEHRTIVLNASNLHEQAKVHFMSTATPNFRRLIRLVTKLLQSVYYDPMVIEVLRSMYLDISKDSLKEIPVEAIGGNILTIVDMFAESIQPTQRLTLDRIQHFQNSIQQKVGSKLYPEVFETFLKVIKEESLRAPTIIRHGQIMIYSENPEKLLALTDRLKYEGFRIIIAHSRSSLSRLCSRCRPDMILLGVDGPARSVFSFVKELQHLHIDLNVTPTIILTPQVSSVDLTPLLEWGIDDILDCECDPDHITFKVKKSLMQVKMSTEIKNTDNQQFASRGSLQDMNLIELLQVLGTSGRTTKLKVISSIQPNQPLEICLKRGQIVYAKVDDIQGVEAIYVGITWNQGTWSMEPITDLSSQLENNNTSNEAILLEGCRLLDEMNSTY